MGNCTGKSRKKAKRAPFLTDYFLSNPYMLRMFVKELEISRRDLVIYKMGTVNLAENVVEFLRQERVSIPRIRHALKALGFEGEIDFSDVSTF